MVDNIAMKSKPDEGRCAHARPSRLLSIFRKYGGMWRCRLDGRCASNDQVSFETEVPRAGKHEVFMCAQSPAFKRSMENNPANCALIGKKFQSAFPKSPLYECLSENGCECKGPGAEVIKMGESRFCGASPAALEAKARAKSEK